MWVGIDYPPDGVDPKWALDIIIVYDPNYSEDKVWKLYSCEENNWGESDPDRPKLKRAWNRKVKIQKNFEGSFYYWSDVEALFHYETLHGDFNCQFLRTLRSDYLVKAEEYQTKLDKSIELVTNLRAAEKVSMSSPEASQQAYKIAEILEPDTMDIVKNPRNTAKTLGRTDSHCPSWPKTLQKLWRELVCCQIQAELLEDADYFYV